MDTHPRLRDLLELIRPALKEAEATEADRAQFLYDLIGEVYDHVKKDLHEPDTNTHERARISAIAHTAIPPTGL